MSVTAAIRSLLDQGFTLEQALAAAEAFEAAAAPTKTARQARNARYYQRKASEKRLKASEASNSDASNLSPEVSPHTPLPTPNPIPPSPPKGGSSPAEVDRAFDAYEAMAERAGLAAPRVKDGTRRSKLAALLKAHGLETWLEAVRRVEASDFCRGLNDRGWRVDLDFMLQAKSFVSLIEGKYDNRSPQPRSGAPPPSAPRNAGEAARLKLINGHLNHEPPDPSPGRLDTSDGQRQAQSPGFARRITVAPVSVRGN